MKNWCLISFLSLTLFSCGSDDEPAINCSLIECVEQSFIIELINSEGVNLIANGTYSEEEIVVKKEGNDLILNASELNAVFFYLAGKEGNNTYEIQLNTSETDTLILDLSVIASSADCCGPFFTVNSALFNGEKQEILDDDTFGLAKIVVVKP